MKMSCLGVVGVAGMGSGDTVAAVGGTDHLDPHRQLMAVEAMAFLQGRSSVE